jgi:hypothetical protein
LDIRVKPNNEENDGEADTTLPFHTERLQWDGNSQRKNKDIKLKSHKKIIYNLY